MMRTFPVLLALALVTSGCIMDRITGGDGDVRPSVGAADRRLAQEPVDARLIDGSTRFALALFGKIADAEFDAAGGPKTNVFLSPASVSFALTMTYNGAAGETREAMARTLGIDVMTLDEANRANLVLLSNLAFGDEKVKLALANSLWGREDVRFADDFLARNRESFGAEVRALDFADPASVDVINGWVEDHTNDRIRDILDAIPRDAILYLVNAIWFKGDWTYRFDRAHTTDAEFTRGDGSTKTVPMMRRSGTFGYLDGDGFAAVRLPYGEEKRFAMYVLLPDAGVPLPAMIDRVTPENWNAWMAGFREELVDLGLPRFKAEYKRELGSDLSALGMGIAFTGDADFSAMFPPEARVPAAISRVIHQSFLEVNEVGTEAAAATVVEIIKTSAPEPIEFVVDRPFLLVIRDDRTGAILFIGAMPDPAVE